MPVERHAISISQLAELLAFDPVKLIGVQVDRQAKTVWILLEPDDKPTDGEK